MIVKFTLLPTKPLPALWRPLSVLVDEEHHKPICSLERGSRI